MIFDEEHEKRILEALTSFIERASKETASDKEKEVLPEVVKALSVFLS